MNQTIELTPEQVRVFKNWVFTEGMSRAVHYARVFSSPELAQALKDQFQEQIPEGTPGIKP